MIKPDAMNAKNLGKILTMVQAGGFKISNIKLARYTRKDAEYHYAEHKVILFVFVGNFWNREGISLKV
jgi:nucleoside-diphosphate kinase